MPQEDLQQANDEATARQIAYFRAIPWCAARLSACSSPLSSPPSEPKTATKTIITQCTSRQLRPAGDNQDLLMSRTLNHADAIPAYIMFYAEPADDPAQLVSEVQSFAALGPMVNGWDGICHGGIVVTLLDEAMGQLFAVNKMRGVMREMPVLTGWLNTRFMKPVRTATRTGASGSGSTGGKGDGDGKGVVLVKARLVKWEGRKFWAEATVEGEDGAVLARADALFVQLRGRL